MNLNRISKLQLIATDLDGTMLYEKNTVTSDNFDAITRKRQQGILYVVATGRCECIVPKHTLPVIDYTITCNGSVITRQSDNQIIHAEYIPRKNARKALSIIRKYHPFLEFFVDGNVMLETDIINHLDNYWVPPFHLSYFQTGRQMVVSSYESFLANDGSRICKLNMPCREYGKMDRLWAELESLNLFEVSSDGSGIELTNKGINKGYALKKLCEKLSISSDHVVAFGNGANDVSMLQYAGYGVAMKNSVPVAMEAAKYLTLSNKENGVAHFLETI